MKARLIAAHIAEQGFQVRMRHALADLGIQHAAGEFGGDGGDEEIQQLAQQLRRIGADIDLERIRAHEMALVRIGLEFGDQPVPFLAHGGYVDLLQRGEIGGVEARAQHRVGLRRFGLAVGRCGLDGLRAHDDQPFASIGEKPTS
jgi:hypothetical protein